MRDVLGPGTILGYCTNVHAGATLAQLKANLESYALEVKQRVCPNEPMSVGLWFSAQAARVLRTKPEEVERLGDWLAESGLLVYTLNGFPSGDFHGEVVKHSVYLPDWSDQRRVEYTIDLLAILDWLLPEGAEGSVSTLPLGWSGAVAPGWADKLGDVFDILADLHDETGRVIHLDLEPEPGCEIEDTQSLFTMWMDFDMHEEDREAFRRHIRVCHDICHAAVMFEDQADVLRAYRNAGIKVGKVQISNAVRVPFDEYSETERREAMQQLSAFAEDRYLHQTMVRMPDGEMRFFEDLPLAIASVAHGQTARGEWRVHFHVPLFLERFGLIQTTQQQIGELLRAIRPEDEIQHFETETYAWNVLPLELRTDDLAAGIARELQWVKDLAAKIGLSARVQP
jgi:sugar phosphate isomerase/epimerase